MAEKCVCSPARRVQKEGLHTASDVAAALTRCKLMIDISHIGLSEPPRQEELPLATTTVQSESDS